MDINQEDVSDPISASGQNLNGVLKNETITLAMNCTGSGHT